MSPDTTEETLRFLGPYPIFGDQAELDDFPIKPGVYVWCVQSVEGFYRVHYVGEAADIRNRIDKHRREQMRGNYHAYSAEDLRHNTKVLVHRAGVGVVPKFQNKMNANQANHQYGNCLSIFYATLPEHRDKLIRCQFETAVGYAVEDWGPNILAVGRLNKRAGRPRSFEIDTGNSNIEGLTGQKLEVFVPENY